MQLKKNLKEIPKIPKADWFASMQKNPVMRVLDAREIQANFLQQKKKTKADFF